MREACNGWDRREKGGGKRKSKNRKEEEERGSFGPSVAPFAGQSPVSLAFQRGLHPSAVG